MLVSTGRGHENSERGGNNNNNNNMPFHQSFCRRNSSLASRHTSSTSPFGPRLPAPAMPVSSSLSSLAADIGRPSVDASMNSNEEEPPSEAEEEDVDGEPGAVESGVASSAPWTVVAEVGAG